VQVVFAIALWAEGRRKDETAVEARQGVTGHNVRYVLAFGICGVIAPFVIFIFCFFGEPAAEVGAARSRNDIAVL
jgi:hypothetical protein